MTAGVAVEERTVLPPQEPEGLAPLLEALGSPEVSVCGGNGRAITLPDSVRDALYNVVLALSQGKGISLIPRQRKLTTQEAADLLNISRPTLVKLLEGGRIPFEKPGRHRKVSLDALLEYQRQTRANRRATLAELTQDSAAEIEAILKAQ
ncbi:helix-turn-helix domain-containing protein [Mycobacterium ostraviense]|uniref:helix-turn-helix domain-containing protein n=1 Tax=Mycobacterium ostraviense TaxID=2738409 RepID=UPI00094C5A28|nr:helix-turn-helix domain-containing protein [Mycobacterium ostraviense]UGT91606.1 helix-turn-helix domain-containing protein [Mycobacterium ostraviense]